MGRRNLTTVADVMKVRQAQKRAAEMQVARADAQLRQLDAAREQSLDTLQDEVARWTTSVTGKSFGLDFAAAWSKAILQGEAELDRLGLQIDDATSERGRLGREWAAASARAEAAQTMGERLRRKARRQREERELGDFADRFAQRRRSP